MNQGKSTSSLYRNYLFEVILIIKYYYIIIIKIHYKESYCNIYTRINQSNICNSKTCKTNIRITINNLVKIN